MMHRLIVAKNSLYRIGRMDASQITKLLQKQNTRYINRCQTIDSSTLTWKNQIQSSKYIKGVKTCDGEQNTNVPTNPACSEGNGICSFGGSGRTSAIQTGSPQQFLNVLAGAAGSGSQVYSSEAILLQKAGKESCAVAGTNPAPANSYVVLPGGNPATSNEALQTPSCSYICTNTNGPTNGNDVPINNNLNPYLPPFDTYYKFKNPAAQCGYPIQDQNQKHFVKECHTRFPNANNGPNAVCNPCTNTTYLNPITKQFETIPYFGQPNPDGSLNPIPPTCDGCILEQSTLPIPCPGPISYFLPAYSPPSPFPGGFSIGIGYTWSPITSGTVSLVPQFEPEVVDTTYLVVPVANGEAVVYTNSEYYTLVLTVTQTGCPTQTATTAPCFLAGSLVTLADGSLLSIEHIKVGDKVLGAFGEINEVLALHQPLLGNNTMTAINEDHHTSSHHPHISSDRKFYAVKPAVAFEGTYGRSHPVKDADGNTVERYLFGLTPERLLTMEEGILLQTTNGPRLVESLRTYSMPPDTQLYNLVVSGSHTYCVDGYAVTGWPSEEDFDYDQWIGK
jgi:hypothetical protein